MNGELVGAWKEAGGIFQGDILVSHRETEKNKEKSQSG
jgi:hypothetical protein